MAAHHAPVWAPVGRPSRNADRPFTNTSRSPGGELRGVAHRSLRSASCPGRTLQVGVQARAQTAAIHPMEGVVGRQARQPPHHLRERGRACREHNGQARARIAVGARGGRGCAGTRPPARGGLVRAEASTAGGCPCARCPRSSGNRAMPTRESRPPLPGPSRCLRASGRARRHRRQRLARERLRRGVLGPSSSVPSPAPASRFSHVGGCGCAISAATFARRRILQPRDHAPGSWHRRHRSVRIRSRRRCRVYILAEFPRTPRARAASIVACAESILLM